MNTTEKYRLELEKDRDTTSVRPLLSDKAIEIISKTLGALEDEYGYHIQVRTSVHTEGEDSHLPKSAVAAVSNLAFPQYPKTTRSLKMFLDPAGINDRADIVPSINHGGFAVNGWLDEDKRTIQEDVCSIITHEYGHVIENMNPDLIDSLHMVGLTWSNHITSDVSEYALSDPWEFGSEIFLETRTDKLAPSWVTLAGYLFRSLQRIPS